MLRSLILLRGEFSSTYLWNAKTTSFQWEWKICNRLSWLIQIRNGWTKLKIHVCSFHYHHDQVKTSLQFSLLTFSKPTFERSIMSQIVASLRSFMSTLIQRVAKIFFAQNKIEKENPLHNIEGSQYRMIPRFYWRVQLKAKNIWLE